MAKNENCVISDSSLCKWINKDCGKCYIGEMKKEVKAREALAHFDVTLSLLPSDLDDLQGDECQFCKNEKGKREGYATIELAHSEPPNETGMFFGFGKKIRQRIGSFLPLSISICKECRNSFKIIDFLKIITSVAMLAIALAIVSIPAVGSAISGYWILLVLVASVIIGYLLGYFLTNAYIKAKSPRMRFNVFDIPICARMRDNGWFLMMDRPKYIFSKRSRTAKLKSFMVDKESEGTATQTTFLKD